MTEPLKLSDEIISIKKKLKAEGALSITIASGSMHPVLKTGNHYCLLPLDEKYVPSKYDILAYWDGEKIIGHYFYSEAKLFNSKEIRWIFKSIVSQVEDFPVSKDFVLGQIDVKMPLYIRTYLAIRSRL